ncbi:MAG TPA: glucosidase, partial [Blastocatellia bacterium]|nr:glucosidase [Blastocatellia bacterium]
MTAEEIRLQESNARQKHWKRWGPYLSERAWGTVREDYSRSGEAWDYLPHDHARSKAYRWNEDGLAGISDRKQNLCFAVALWNGRDPILKERLFGLTGSEGNHGEDVKEYYFYLDSTPTHSYMKYLYKYPQAEFPYAQLIERNRNRSKREGEYELMDTGVFDDDRYFDVFVEYAKADVEDILIQITIANRGPEAATLHVLPTLWFRNRWSWGNGKGEARPSLKANKDAVEILHHVFGERFLYYDGAPELLFTDNETNARRLYGVEANGYYKDGINDYVVNGAMNAVNPEMKGTKAAAHYVVAIEAGATKTLRLRLAHEANRAPFADFDALLQQRQREADEFYDTVIPADVCDDNRNVMRQAFAGMLWSKQFYHYVVEDWLKGDPGHPPPPRERHNGRNN